MSIRSRIAVTRTTPGTEATVEICEHKGVGHPDTVCDDVAEAVSRALCRAYIDAYGAVQHYNVDKALLIGGVSEPRFGGGRVVEPMRLILAGRATPLPDIDLGAFIRTVAERQLAATLRCASGLIVVEPVVRPGSPALARAIGNGTPLANDTSFGAGFAPRSRLEESVLHLADILHSAAFRGRFPAAGDDYKIMGSHCDGRTRFVVALALVDSEVASVAEYIAIKTGIAEHLRSLLDRDAELIVNALDDPQATDPAGLYLTVTGLSAEHGDDGQVGRGNRVGGLITPGRPMSLEAVAGKNSVIHVGKLYNVLAFEMAEAIADADPSITEVRVQVLSTIGDPVAAPTLIAIDIRAPADADHGIEERTRETARRTLRRIDELPMRLLRGEIRLY